MIKTPIISYLFIFGMVCNLILPRFFALGKFIYPSFIISAFFSILWILITVNKKSINIDRNIHYICLIILSIFLSYSYAIFFSSYFFPNYIVSISSVANELLIYVPMLPFFLVLNHLKITDGQIRNTIIFCFIVFISVGTLQYLGVDKAISAYTDNESHVTKALKGFRLIITGGNPNDGGIIASFFVMYFLSGFFYKKNIFDLFLSFIALTLMFLTISRTTIIGSLTVILIFTLVTYRIKVIYKLLTLVFIIFSVSFLLNNLDLTYLINGIETLNEGDNASVNVRLGHIDYAITNFLHSPIFGWGSFLEISGPVRFLDSEILYILQRYGLFGAFIIIYIIFNILKTGFKYKNSGQLGIFMILMMSSLMFNMLTNVVFLGKQVSSIIVFLIFLIYYLNNKSRTCDFNRCSGKV